MTLELKVGGTLAKVRVVTWKCGEEMVDRSIERSQMFDESNGRMRPKLITKLTIFYTSVLNLPRRISH